MKKLYSILFAVLLLLASCAKDPDLATPEIPVPVPTPDSHVVPVETALAELNAVLGDNDGQRSGWL